MLPSQAALPPLHRNIQVKRNGSWNHAMTVNTWPEKRLVGSFDTASLIRNRPRDAAKMRSDRFSYGCGNQTDHTNQKRCCPTSVKRPRPFIRTGDGCSTGTSGAVTTSSFSHFETTCDRAGGDEAALGAKRESRVLSNGRSTKQCERSVLLSRFFQNTSMQLPVNFDSVSLDGLLSDWVGALREFSVVAVSIKSPEDIGE